MAGCLFCDRSHLHQLAVWQSNYFYGFFEIHPVSPGHFCIVPVRHVERLIDLRPEEWDNLNIALTEAIRIIQITNLHIVYGKYMKAGYSDKVSQYCTEALIMSDRYGKPQSYNHGINEGLAAGRTVHHLNWHIIPRYMGDVADPTGGIRGVIPGKGNYTQ
jgi:histidine triad (HIT) family protein